MNPCYKCQHAHVDCVPSHAVLCTRFLPNEGTNLVELKGVIEVQPDIDSDKFADLLVDWVEDNGWKIACIVSPYKEEVDDEGQDND